MSRPVMIVKKSSGTWWKCLLAFIGGIFFTIAAAFGGLAFAAAGVNTGTLLGQYSYLLTEEYQNKTVLDIVTEVIDGKLTFNNLGDVAKVTPEVEKIFDAVNDSFEKAGIHMEIRFEDIKDEPWASIDVKIIDTFKSGVTLADILKVTDESEPIMHYLSYPKKDDGTYDKEHPYTLGQFMDDSNFFNNLIDNLKIGDVVKPDPDNLLLQALVDYTLSDLENKDKLYGIKLGTLFSEEDKNNNPLLKTLSDKDWTINDLSDGDKFKTLKIGELVEPTDGTLLYAIKDKTVNDLDNKDSFDDVEVGSIITVDDSSTPIIKYLEHKQIGELKDDDFVNDMYISDIFTEAQINDSRVLKALNNLPKDPADPTLGTGCKVGDIGKRVDELELKDVMDTTSGNKLVKALENEKIGGLNDAINNLNVGDVIEYYEKDPSDGKYYSDQACTQELSPVLTRLIGNDDEIQTPVGNTVTLKNEDFRHVVFKNGDGEEKTDYLNISTFIQNTEITISKHVEIVDEQEVVTWVAEGSGTASPARDPYIDTFTVEVNFPAEWTSHAYYCCNKPTNVNKMNESVDDLRIKDIMKIEPGSAFDKPAIRNSTINNADTIFNTIKSELTLGEVVTVTDSSSQILKSLKDTKLDEIGTKVDDLEFADVVEHYEKDPPDGKHYSDEGCTQELPKLLCTFIDNGTKVKNISSAVDDLKVSEVVTYYEKDPSDGKYYSDKECTEELSQILTTFINNDTKVKDMGTAVGNLTISEVLTAEQRDNRFLSKIPPETKITAVGSALENLKLVDVFEDQIFDTENADPAKKDKLVSTWKYLLIEGENSEAWIDGNPDISTDPLHGYACENYKISDLNKLISNMSSNISKATLNDLQKDGIADLNSGKAWDDPTGFLAKPIPNPPFTPPAGKTTFGQLTLQEFANMVSSMA